MNQLEIEIPINGDIHTICVDMPEDEEMRTLLIEHFNNPHIQTQIAEVLPAYKPSHIEEYFALAPVKLSEFITEMTVCKKSLYAGQMTKEEFLSVLTVLLSDALTWDRQFVREELLVQWTAIEEMFVTGVKKCQSPEELLTLHTSCMARTVELVNVWKSQDLI